MILLTRTKERCQETRSKYPGFNFVDFPCIEYSKPSEGYGTLDNAIRKNHHYEWVFFLSRKAAESFFERLLAIGGNFFNLATHLKFAVIGEATKDFFENEINMPIDFMPSKSNTECFIKEFLEKYSFDFNSEMKILLPRSELAQDDFKDKLEAGKNYVIEIVAAYNTVCPSYTQGDLDNFEKDFINIEAIVFASPSSVHNFNKLFPNLDISKKKILSSGTLTTKSFKELYPEHRNLTESSKSNINALFDKTAKD